ncbi:hypothetical protein [Oryza sativa Japonica Group]|uniref:Secreted protein n=1 Tax=Oryza sativa subsp. japonica TaxID=39947 RepID=Q5ZDK8_ORYSJ|nr:hypothetical protein [Oryza sativa Japonica Group]
MPFSASLAISASVAFAIFSVDGRGVAATTTVATNTMNVGLGLGVQYCAYHGWTAVVTLPGEPCDLSPEMESLPPPPTAPSPLPPTPS